MPKAMTASLICWLHKLSVDTVLISPSYKVIHNTMLAGMNTPTSSVNAIELHRIALE